MESCPKDTKKNFSILYVTRGAPVPRAWGGFYKPLRTPVIV